MCPTVPPQAEGQKLRVLTQCLSQKDFTNDQLTGQAERLQSLKTEGQDCRGPGGQGLNKVPGSEREAETEVHSGGESTMLGDSESLPGLVGSEGNTISNVETKHLPGEPNSRF